MDEPLADRTSLLPAGVICAPDRSVANAIVFSRFPILHRIAIHTAFHLAEKSTRELLSSLSLLDRRHRVGWTGFAFLFVLTLSGFRKIVDPQRQKHGAHSLGGNA
jgi:hypothetical protein